MHLALPRPVSGPAVPSAHHLLLTPWASSLLPPPHLFLEKTVTGTGQAVHKEPSQNCSCRPPHPPPAPTGGASAPGGPGSVLEAGHSGQSPSRADPGKWL